MHTMIKRTILLMIALLAAFVLPALAQDSGGQFWVQAFEDRNGNGQHDPGEPFLTSGVSVDLLNADGVVMASGTLDDAPYASQGYLGFLHLAPGSYTAVISSDLTATTPDRVDVTVTQGEAPIKVMFGAQQAGAAEAEAPSSGVSSLLNSELARIALSGFGAAVVVGMMILIGVLVYMLVLRPRAPSAVRRTTTGSMRPVRVDETGELRRTGEIRQTGETRKP